MGAEPGERWRLLAGRVAVSSTPQGYWGVEGIMFGVLFRFYMGMV